jgi:hypothetical protein
MPNAIKYSTTGDTLSLKKGNIFFGVGDVGKGPSSATTYYNGVTPPSGGYTIYSYNVAQTSKLSFHTAVDDSALVRYTATISGQNFSTATECLNWYATQSNYVCVNRDYEGIVTNGLVLNVDAGFTPSYTSSGTTWYDLSYGVNNGVLTNGPTFNSSNGGSIVFDGVDDCIVVNSNANILSKTSYTKISWFYITSYLYNIISGGNSGQHAFWLAGTNKLHAGHNGQWSTVVSTTSLSLNTWYFGAVTFNTSTGWVLYVNGVQEATSSSTATYTGADEILIGAYGTGSNVFAGRIAVAQVYNRVLSASEILQNYNAQVSRFSESYDSDAQAFFTAAGITDTTQKNAVNQLVLDLKSYGIWSSMIAIYPFVGGTATTNKYNLKNPNTFQITFGGGWTHSSTGSLPNGTNAYADTGISPYNNLGSNHNYSVYSRTNNNNGGNTIGSYELGGYVCGENGYVTDLQLYLRNFDYVLVRDQTNGGYYQISNTSSLGNFSVNRNSTSLTVYKNGSSIGSTSASQALPGTSISLSAAHVYDFDCGTEYYDTFDDRQLAFATFANASLTSTNVSNLNTAVQAFQTTLGRNV